MINSAAETKAIDNSRYGSHDNILRLKRMKDVLRRRSVAAWITQNTASHSEYAMLEPVFALGSPEGPCAEANFRLVLLFARAEV